MTEDDQYPDLYTATEAERIKVLIQSLLAHTGNWVVDERGVRRLSTRNSEQIACSHQILPVGRLINEEMHETKIKLAFRRGKEDWKTLVVDHQTIVSARTIVALASYGISVTSNTASLLVDYLNDMLEQNYYRIPVSTCVSRMGYLSSIGFVPYVNEAVFSGDPSFGPLYCSVNPRGELSSWIDIAVECRKNSIEARLLLAASFASPLISIVGGLPFFSHLWSEQSGNGKTVALMLAASVWADPEPGHYIQSFNATQVGLEYVAAFLNHLPICIDELQLSNNGNRTSSIDVYQLAEGIGRSRGRKNGAIDRLLTWRCAIISTGETPIVASSAGSGAMNRVLEIEVQTDKGVIRDGHRISNQLRNHHGLAGPLFIGKLYESQDSLNNVRIRFQSHYKELLDMDATEKQAMSAALLLTADDLATEWIIQDDSSLSSRDLICYLSTKSSVSAGRRAYEWLNGWIASNTSHFYRGAIAPSGATYGVIEENLACIIRTVLDSCLKDAGFSPGAVLSYLRIHKLIVCRDKGFTKTKRVGGIATECVWLVIPDDPTQKL